LASSILKSISKQLTMKEHSSVWSLFNRKPMDDGNGHKPTCEIHSGVT